MKYFEFLSVSIFLYLFSFSNMNPSSRFVKYADDPASGKISDDLTRGLETDEVLLPGRHKFRRGGFLKRHGLVSAQIPAPVKIIISVGADADILNRSEVSHPSVLSCAETLLSDKHFIEAVTTDADCACDPAL